MEEKQGINPAQDRERAIARSGLGYGVAIVICVMLVLFSPNYAQFQLSPLASQVMETYNLDPTQFSSLFSAAMIPGILLSLVAGLLCDRFGAKRTIALGTAITLLGLVIRVFAPDYSMLFAGMILAGVAATFINANLAKIMGQWFKPEHMGIALGIAMAASTGAQAVGMGTSALFPNTNVLFVFTATLAAVSLLIWLVFFKEKPAKTASVAGASDFAQPSLGECLKAVISSKNIWFLGTALGLCLAIAMCVASFTPLVLQTQRGMDPVASGAISTVLTIGNLSGTIIMPMINARVGHLKPVVITFAFIAAAGAAFSWQMPEGFPMASFLFMTGFALSGIIVSLMSVPFLLPEIGPVYAGTAGGVASTLQLVGGVVIPSYIMMPIIGENWILFFIVAGILCIGLAACVMLLPEVLKQQPAPEEPV